MPLTPFQADVFKIISVNRNPDSYVAGATVIHRDANSPRFSRDIDLFHDTSDAVIASAEADEVALKAAGFAIEFSLQRPTFYRAELSRDDQQVRLEWAADTAFRFFPIIEDAVLGYRLHDGDVATNKVLAAAGRDKVRDFIDLIHLDRTYVALGVSVWAAAGKDDGYTPEFIIDQMRRHSRINPDTLKGVKFTHPADPVALKKEWMECLQAAETLIASFPSDHLGCLYLDQTGQPARGNTFDPSWVPHYGSVKGAWPNIS